KLNRGERTVEVLKQGLHEPLPAEKQVMILFALTRGLLDDIAVEDVVRFESEFHVWIDTNEQEVLNTIRETGKLAEEEDMKNVEKAVYNTVLPTEKKYIKL